MLKFSEANSKIERLSVVPSLQEYLTNNRNIYSFDLLSGYSCPFAKTCLSKAIRDELGKTHIEDGVYTETRCFSASQEAQYKNVFNLRQHNFDILARIKKIDEMADTIQSSLPSDSGIIRIHVAGDFFNQVYMLGWIQVIRNNPDKLFYAYTKSLPYWINHKRLIDDTQNLVMTASYGGKYDHFIDQFNLRYSRIVFSESEANTIGLEIDHDDSHAADPSKKAFSFALLLHGTQPKGSEAAKALKELKGLGSYSRAK